MNEANIPVFMEPQWFFPLFAAIWLGISALLSRLGGWANLAGRFRALQPESGESFRFVSGAIDANSFPVSYRGCLFVTVNSRGFHLSLLFLFRFQSPPLFIPWSEVESVEEKRFLFARRAVIRLRSQWPVISVYGSAGQSIAHAHKRSLLTISNEC